VSRDVPNVVLALELNQQIEAGPALCDIQNVETTFKLELLVNESTANKLAAAWRDSSPMNPVALPEILAILVSEMRG
jgi:hypothetical protein